MKTDYTKLINHDDVEEILDKAKGLAGLIDSMYFAHDNGTNKFDKHALLALWHLANTVVIDIEEAQPKIDFMYGVAYDAFKAKESAE